MRVALYDMRSVLIHRAVDFRILGTPENNVYDAGTDAAVQPYAR